jgi:hypothetical protein
VTVSSHVVGPLGLDPPVSSERLNDHESRLDGRSYLSFDHKPRVSCTIIA